MTADTLFDGTKPPPAAGVGMPASALLQMLHRHHVPEGRTPAGLFATEVESPCGTRRADALWLPFRRSADYALHGFEVKVSRSDLIVELDDPAKAEPWLQYCRYWWLVVAHPNLVTGLDIPVEWGIMSPPSGRRTRTMTVLRSAPRLRPRNPAPGLGRLIGWQSFHDDLATEQLRRDRKKALEDAEYFKHRVEQLQAAGATARAPREAQMIGRIVDRVSSALAAEGIYSRLDRHEDAIVAAVINWAATVDLASTVARHTESLLRDIDHVVAPLRGVRADLDRIRRTAAAAAKAHPSADPDETRAMFLLGDQLGAVPVAETT